MPWDVWCYYLCYSHYEQSKETEPSNINQGNEYSVNQGQKSSTIFYTTHQNHRRFGWKKVLKIIAQHRMLSYPLIAEINLKKN